MKANRAFTLIELLVVIAIIALLLSIVMPALRKAKAQAQYVICKSNLHQWGLIFQLYTQENNGKFHRGWRDGAPDDLWLHVLRPYYTDNDDVRTCPSATKLQDDAGAVAIVGGSRFAWGRRIDWVSDSGDPFNYGSYGLNGYVCSDESPLIHGNDREYWKTITVKGDLSKIPILLDSAYWKSYVEMLNPPPPVSDYLHYYPSMVHSNYMAAHSIDRHNRRVNAVFFDLSSDSIGLKSLWSLKWNPLWKQPRIIDWPEWMKSFPE